MGSREKRQAVWGPRFPNMDQWVKDKSLIEVCAKQWFECVSLSDQAFEKMPNDKWIKVYYEDLVTDPTSVLDSINDWYGDNDAIRAIPDSALDRIHSGSLYGWKQKSQSFSQSSLETMMDCLKKHDYEYSV